MLASFLKIILVKIEKYINFQYEIYSDNLNYSKTILILSNL